MGIGGQSEATAVARRRLSAAQARLLAAAVIIVGVGLRVALMRHYDDDLPDQQAIQSVIAALRADFLHAYHATHTGAGITRTSWTYPAGLFPLLLLDHVLLHTGLSLRTLLAIPNFFADVAMSILVYRFLADRRGPGAALAGCALIALGWPFVLDTGVMSQCDSLSTLIALVAVLVWSRGARHRVVWASLLLGIATSIKLPFGFLVLAFLPTCDGWRERVRVVAIVAAVPLLVTAPFLLADFHQVVRAISGNHGLPGMAGWTLFVEPALRHSWLDQHFVPQSSLVSALARWQPEIVLAVVVPTGAVLWRRRVEAIPAAATIALAIWASNVSPLLTFMVWLIPFLVLDEQMWAAGLIQATGLVAAVQLFLLTPHPWAESLYLPALVVMQLVVVVVYVVAMARVVSARSPAQRPSGQLGTARDDEGDDQYGDAADHHPKRAPSSARAAH